MDALKKYRATPIHRKSFKPVSNALPSISWVIKNNRINWLGQKLAALYLKKLNFKKIEILNKRLISKNIDIVCFKSNVHHFINVFSSHQKINKKTKEHILKKSYDSFIQSVEQSEIIDFEKQKSVFGYIFVEIKKGGPNIIFKENIF
jgi:predicted transcriptional regulator